MVAWLVVVQRHDENDREPPTERQVHARDLLYAASIYGPASGAPALEVVEVHAVPHVVESPEDPAH